MANKKYVIMRSPKGGSYCTTLPADNNRLIKSYQDGGYKIVGRMSCNDGFVPTHAVLVKPNIQSKKPAER